jgi:hypothetical protein
MKEFYVIVTKEGRYIDIDQSSGGYPYETLISPKLWTSKKEAKSYANKFGERSKDWSLHTFEISTKPCSWI